MSASLLHKLKSEHSFCDDVIEQFTKQERRLDFIFKQINATYLLNKFLIKDLFLYLQKKI